jgi:virginiamycin A acetyltransferase
MRRILKAVVNWLFVVLALPAALLAGFGHFKIGFDTFAQLFSLVPGVIGVFARRAYYFLTLESCSLRCIMPFGVFCTHHDTIIEDHVVFGANAIVGRVHIGHHTFISGNVQTLSGRRLHARDADGNFIVQKGPVSKVSIGANAWIGTSAIIMANVGEGTTIGAGAVVTKDIPPRVVAVGIPATVIKSA